MNRRQLLKVGGLTLMSAVNGKVLADPLQPDNTGWIAAVRRDIAMNDGPTTANYANCAIFEFPTPWLLIGPHQPNRQLSELVYRFEGPRDKGPILTIYRQKESNLPLMWFQANLSSGIRVDPAVNVYFSDTDGSTLSAFTSTLFLRNFNSNQACTAVTSVDDRQLAIHVENNNDSDNLLQRWFQNVTHCYVEWSGPAADCNI